MKKIIEDRIRELTINKADLLKRYPDAEQEEKDILSVQNGEWSIELNFLKKLLESFEEQSYGLLLHEIPYEDLRKEIESSLRVAKAENYGDYNTAGLILSDLKLSLKKKANQ